MGVGTQILQVLEQNVLQYCKNKVYYYIIVMTQEVQTRECRC